MKLLMMVVAAASAVVVSPKASHLRPGGQCFTITRGGTAVGKTWQEIRSIRAEGRRAWDVVVHQRQDDGSFDMRDHFVLDHATLRPITLDSQRGADRDARGWQRVALHYSADRVTGTRETKEGVASIDVALDHPVWDGNLWGLTFASLPLRAAGRYTLPFWQYDKGFGTFTVNVVGREDVDVPGGRAVAWVLEAGDDPSHLMRYFVASSAPMEIGYRAGPFGQTLGGDCTALSAATSSGSGRSRE